MKEKNSEEKFILLIRCVQPYPVDCKHRKENSYIKRERNKSTECLDYFACGFVATSNPHNKCKYSELFNPLIRA